MIEFAAARRIAMIVGPIILAALLWVAWAQFQEGLRREGEARLQAEIQVRVTQAIKRDSEAKDLVSAALAGQVDAIRRQSAQYQRIIADLRTRRVTIGAGKNATETRDIPIDECRLPDDIYRQLCQQLTCAAGTVRNPETGS